MSFRFIITPLSDNLPRQQRPSSIVSDHSVRCSTVVGSLLETDYDLATVAGFELFRCEQRIAAGRGGTESVDPLRMARDL